MSLTSVTTAAGFLSFAASDIESVASFGVFAAAGIAFCWAWTFTVVPAALSLVAPDRVVAPLPGRGEPWRPARAVAALTRRRGRVLGAFVVLAGLAVAGLPRLTVQDGWLDGFAPGDPFRRSMDRFHQRFVGGHLLLVEVSFEGVEDAPRGSFRRGPLLDPARLEALGRFEETAAALPGVGGSWGPTRT